MTVPQDQADRSARRNFWLIVSYAVLGPIIGGVAHIVLMMLNDPYFLSIDQHRLIYDVLIILAVAYVTGFTPALLTGLAVVAVFPLLLRPWQRLAIAAMIGATLSFLMALPFFMLRYGPNAFDTSFKDLLVGASYGALAAVVCLAIVEKCFPLKPGRTRDGAS